MHVQPEVINGLHASDLEGTKAGNNDCLSGCRNPQKSAILGRLSQLPLSAPPFQGAFPRKIIGFLAKYVSIEGLTLPVERSKPSLEPVGRPTGVSLGVAALDRSAGGCVDFPGRS